MFPCFPAVIIVVVPKWKSFYVIYYLFLSLCRWLPWRRWGRCWGATRPSTTWPRRPGPCSTTATKSNRCCKTSTEWTSTTSTNRYCCKKKVFFFSVQVFFFFFFWFNFFFFFFVQGFFFHLASLRTGDRWALRHCLRS